MCVHSNSTSKSMVCLQTHNRCAGFHHLSEYSCMKFVKDCTDWVKENYIHLNKEKLCNNNRFALGLHTEGNRMIVIIFHKPTIHQQVAGKDAVCLPQKWLLGAACPSHMGLKDQGAAQLCAHQLHIYRLTTPQSKSLLTNQLMAWNRL